MAETTERAQLIVISGVLSGLEVRQQESFEPFVLQSSEMWVSHLWVNFRWALG